MENGIRGAVFSVFKDITSFAKGIGWSRNKASRILNGKQMPSMEDAEKIAECVGITDASTFVSVFFPRMSTK